MQMNRQLFACLLCLACLASACGPAGGELDPLPVPPGCNPLAADWDCMLPYPSDFFLVDDPSLPSGRRVEHTGGAVVRTADGEVADPTLIHPADGFSHIHQILAVFPAGVDPSGPVSHTGDVTASLAPSSPTLLLEAETGRAVLHFAELDPRAETDARRALLIRPLERLRDGARHIVAIHGLCGTDGSLLEAPEGFRRIRDAQAGGHELLEPLAARYDQEIFPALEAFGLERSELQLAWDFSTQTFEHLTADMLSVREQVIARFAARPPEITILEVEDDIHERIARRVEGTILVPLFVESTEPGARLVRDASGEPVAGADVAVPFTALIPRSVAERQPADPPARLLQYGHGFFGRRDNLSELGHIYPLLDGHRFVLVSADWWGMSIDDSMPVAGAIAERPSEIMVFTDRVHQAMANFIALAYAAEGPLLQQPEMQLGPQPMVDPSQLYFYGISQGHILGGTYAALTPHAERIALSVGGAGLSFIMFRARPFAAFLELIDIFFDDPLDIQKYTASTQLTFDRVDPITYAPHVLADTFPESPASRSVLMHVGIGDPAVPNLASHLHARALGLGLLQPAPREIAGLDPVSAPFDGSALVEFDFGIDPLPGILATPPEQDNEVHEGVRELDAAVRQIDLFFRKDGQIEHCCDGICDPE
ncbi:MAG: hypothetical protein JXR96_07925 [Deltaproteobacteria bacterium]|nr:hypothetical protein [Deltaproteobacteria bacterium]